MRLGGDLSNYDWPLSLSQVAEMRASGWERVIVGCQREDPALGLVRVCREGGLQVTDLYTYLYFGYDVLAEVAKALRVAREVGGIRRIWLDCEADGEAPGCTPDSRVSQLRQAVATVEGAGYTAGIYTGAWFWPSQMGNTTEFSRLPLWHAAYFTARTIIQTVDYGGWSRLAIHQYASTPALAGRNRDYDAFFEEEEDMAALDEIKAVIVGNGIDVERDGAMVRLTGEEAWQYAVTNGWSLGLGLGLVRDRVSALEARPASGPTGGIPEHTHEPGGVQR